jgi:hypothetical protein
MKLAEAQSYYWKTAPVGEAGLADAAIGGGTESWPAAVDVEELAALPAAPPRATFLYTNSPIPVVMPLCAVAQMGHGRHAQGRGEQISTRAWAAEHGQCLQKRERCHPMSYPQRLSPSPPPPPGVVYTKSSTCRMYSLQRRDSEGHVGSKFKGQHHHVCTRNVVFPVLLGYYSDRHTCTALWVC